jgi:catechol 2,3-dioxygenase-like lactoylglutathione lyase family enzyme
MTEIKAACPVLFVGSIPNAIEYYVERLGFEVIFGDGETYSILKRGEAEVHLARDADRAGKAGAYLYVTGVDELHAEWKASDAEIRSVPRDQPYGMRDFYLDDLDGNMIGVGEASTD